jgi:hypothetical protein
MALSQPHEGLLISLSDFLFLSSNQVVTWRATPAAQTYYSPDHLITPANTSAKIATLLMTT